MEHYIAGVRERDDVEAVGGGDANGVGGIACRYESFSGWDEMRWKQSSFHPPEYINTCVIIDKVVRLVELELDEHICRLLVYDYDPRLLR